MNKSFEINSYFYPKSFVLQAIDDFTDVTEITYNNGKLNVNGEDDKDIENIFNEFMNYATGLINEL